MTRSKQDLAALKAFTHYKNMFIALDIKPINALSKNKEFGDKSWYSFSHLHWMCDECIHTLLTTPEDFPVDKYSRWLGFIQGVVICKGYSSVEKERNITRPWFTYG